MLNGLSKRPKGRKGSKSEADPYAYDAVSTFDIFYFQLDWAQRDQKSHWTGWRFWPNRHRAEGVKGIYAPIGGAVEILEYYSVMIAIQVVPRNSQVIRRIYVSLLRTIYQRMHDYVFFGI